jgi:hypothetical protein
MRYYSWLHCWRTAGRQALVAAVLACVVAGAHASVDPKNLVRNGDFEEPGSPPPGWKIEAGAGEGWDLSPDALTGKQALRLSLPVAGSVTATSDPCSVIGGDDYLLTFWGRGDGAKKGGGQATCYVIWQDAAGKDLGTLTVTSNGPTPDYGVCTYTLTAPATAVGALVRFTAGLGGDYQGPPTAFYFDQTRLMHLSPRTIPAGAKTWQYLCRQLSTGLQMVEDKDAEQGQAIMAQVGVATPHGMPLTWGQYTREQIPGDYLVTYRLKVKDNSKPEPVASLGMTDIGSYNYVLCPSRTILATEFKAPGVYQEFTMRFVRPEEGMLEWNCVWQGTTDLYFDKSIVTQLAAFATDKELAAVLLGE